MNRAGFAGLLVAVTSLADCGGRGEPDSGVPPAEDVAPSLPDSLLLSAPGGVTIWFTEGRPGADPAGATCVERTLEIRRDTSRIKVPLLYTVTVPTLLDDSTLRAELAHNCQPAEPYRVDLRTGHPTRILEPAR
jgi:hypothetical protein